MTNVGKMHAIFSFLYFHTFQYYVSNFQLLLFIYFLKSGFCPQMRFHVAICLTFFTIMYMLCDEDVYSIGCIGEQPHY